MNKQSWKEMDTQQKCELLQSVCQGDIMSAGQISSALTNKVSGPPPTRNAVIGIIDRHAPKGVRLHHKGYSVGPRKEKMSPQSLANLAKSSRRRPTKNPAGIGMEPARHFSHPVPAPAPLNLTCLEIGSDQCRYATNDAMPGEQHLFCGHPTKKGSSYCAAHHEACYNTAGMVNLMGIAA